MKEEIERRRAEAAEKRQKAEETDEGEVKSPFKCISPRGSSLKVSHTDTCQSKRFTITMATCITLSHKCMSCRLWCMVCRYSVHRVYMLTYSGMN